jgi:hypothetical protein
MIDTKDIHWLAGLLEGEGCFQYRRYKSKISKQLWYPQIKVEMTDLDPIAKAAKLLGNKVNRGKLLPSGKRCYLAQVMGRRAIEWMMTLYSLMGERRRAKIKEIITAWKNNAPKQGRPYA